MNKDYKITIEPISEDAKRRMNGPRVYECDSLFSLAVCREPFKVVDQTFYELVAVGTLVGSHELVATALANYLFDAAYPFRRTIFRALMGSCANSEQRYFCGREDTQYVPLMVRQQLADATRLARILASKKD